MAGCAFASMVEHYIGSYEMNAPYLGGCALHDPLAVAVAIDPTLVGALGCNLRVDLLGEYRGRTICDERRLSDPDKSALVALVDAPALPVRVQGAHGPRSGLSCLLGRGFFDWYDWCDHSNQLKSRPNLTIEDLPWSASRLFR